MCLALRASGLWLRYAALQNLIPSFPWIVPHALHPGAIQGKEGIKFCHLATLAAGARPDAGAPRHGQDGGDAEGGERGGEAVQVRAVPPLLRGPRCPLETRDSDRDVQRFSVVLINDL